MAEQIVSSATSAVTGELARILFSGLVGRLDNRQQAAGADKKLRQLELLLIKVHSAVEASEKHHPIENAWLLKWRDTLKEAAAEGDEVLAGFRQRQRASMDAAAQGQGPGDAAHHRQQEQDRPSSSSSATTASAAPSGATKALLFSSDEDMERLNSAVERLEELSPQNRLFLKLLKLEIILTPEHVTAENRGRVYACLENARPAGSTRTDSSPGEPHGLEILSPEGRSTENTEGTTMVAKRKRPSANSGDGPALKFGCKAEAGLGRALLMAPSMSEEESSEESCRKTPMDQTVVEAAREEEEERSTLVERLEEAFATICKTVELADGRDLSRHECLAHWASILREAKWQGCAVLGAIGAGAGEEVARCDDQDSELGRLVCGVESLAGEADYFAGLACLCPSY